MTGIVLRNSPTDMLREYHISDAKLLIQPQGLQGEHNLTLLEMY